MRCMGEMTYLGLAHKGLEPSGQDLLVTITHTIGGILLGRHDVGFRMMG